MRNLALNKPAYQSSISQWSVYSRRFEDAALGNNGDTKSERSFHTRKELDPWWQVDLQDLFLLRRVKITNHALHPERLKHFSLLRSCDGRDWIECGRWNSGDVFAEAIIDVAGEHIARFVRIRLNGSGFLHFRECEIFGDACDAATCERLIEADSALLRRRKLIPEGRTGEVVELGGLHVFVDDSYGPRVRDALRRGGYEQIEREFTLGFLRPGDRVLEAGTALGVVAMTAASIVGAGAVRTFDASPAAVEDARRNFVRNGLDEIQAVQGLLANRRHYRPGTTARFGLAKELWASRLPGGDDADITDYAEAPIHCLEDEIEAFGANVLICDIEGAEVDLLADADLSRLRLIILETHYWARGEDATDEMIARLTEMGFAIHLGVSRANVVVMRRRGATV